MAAALALGACGDDADQSNNAAGNYVAATNVPSGDEFFTLVGYVDTLDEDEAELDSETEHAGFAALLRSPAAPNAYFVGSGESPEVRRYDDVDGRVVAGRTVSFADLGLPYAPGSTETAFDEDGLAYSVSVDQALVVVWNVDTMEIERTIELEGLLRDDYSPVYPLSMTLRGDTLVFPLSYTDFDTGETPALTVLVSVDIETDEVRLAEDDRCSGIRGLTAAADGTLYGATDGFFAVRRRLYGEAAGTEPCILRVLPDETRFDPDYEMASRELVDSAIVGDLAITADGRSIIFNVFDEDAFPIAEDAVYGEVARAAGWRRYIAPLAAISESSGGGTPIDGLEAGARQGINFNVDGRSWLVIASADYSSSQLFEITSDEEAVAGPAFSGSLGALYAL